MTVLLGLNERLRAARLSIVTRLNTDRDANAAFLRAAFKGGADLIEIITSGVDRKVARERLEDARTIAYDYQGIIVVRDDLALAKDYLADALHLGATGAATVDARKSLSEWALLGRSVHSVQLLDDAIADGGLSYLSVGPVFGGNAQFKAPGLDLIRAAAQKAPVLGGGIAWFATGGITLKNAQQVIDAGACRLRVGAAAASDTGRVCAELDAMLGKVWSSPQMQDVIAGVNPQA